MEITIPIKLAIASEIIEEMIRFGHTQAATHIESYRKRQLTKLQEEVDALGRELADNHAMCNLLGTKNDL